jgi:UTP--glucose-1-phosphate uridylyltransferase
VRLPSAVAAVPRDCIEIAVAAPVGARPGFSPPEIFDSLQAIDPGSGGEIQLTDALKHLLRSRPIYAYRFEGSRYDAGDKLGFPKAIVEFALRRRDLGGPFRECLKGLKL